MSSENIKKLAGKYLTFILNNEIYGIEILKVHEIIGLIKPTPIPQTPDYVSGYINLRDSVIPVIDLRLKFKTLYYETTERTCTIIVQLKTNDSEVKIGLIVDEVSEVTDIKEENVEQAPSFGSNVDINFILGVGKLDNKVVMLLNADKILTTSDIKQVAEIAK